MESLLRKESERQRAHLLRGIPLRTKVQYSALGLAVTIREIPVPTSSDIICLLYDELSVLKALGRLLASEGLQAEKLRVIGPPRASARPRRFDFEKKVETSRFHTQPSQHNHESDVGQRIWNV